MTCSIIFLFPHIRFTCCSEGDLRVVQKEIYMWPKIQLGRNNHCDDKDHFLFVKPGWRIRKIDRSTLLKNL